jgi:hypothetical protein
MRGSQLAKALADITNRKPELDLDLREHLRKWVKSTLMKGATLESLRTMQEVAGAAFIAWHLEQQAEKDLAALTKKLDPYLPDTKSRGTQYLRSHLAQLCAKQIEPAAKPERPAAGGRGAPRGRAVEEIFRLGNSLQRRMELEKLSPAELKAAIKKHDLGIGGLSSKPSKVEMIEHIQATLAAGWPCAATALDESKY